MLHRYIYHAAYAKVHGVMQISPPQKDGFTIVELLIVVVVIAILAAITIVSYRGISTRAIEASARSDINALGKKFEIYKIENGKYPTIPFSSVDTTVPDVEVILRSSGLYSATRSRTNPLDATKQIVDKGFVFCMSPDGSRIAIVATVPVTGDMPSTSLSESVGKKLIYYSSGTFGETTFKYDTGIQDTGLNVCKSVIPDYDYTTWPRRWSFDVPTVKAQ